MNENNRKVLYGTVVYSVVSGIYSYHSLITFSINKSNKKKKMLAFDSKRVFWLMPFKKALNRQHGKYFLADFFYYIELRVSNKIKLFHYFKKN